MTEKEKGKVFAGIAFSMLVKYQGFKVTSIVLLKTRLLGQKKE